MDQTMRTCFVSLSITLSFGALAQSWCAPEAVWHHTYADANTGVFGYVRTDYTGDTVVDGSVCQKLESMLYGYDQQLQIPVQQNVGQRITRGQNDLIELWDGSGFDTLYWFSAVLGDGWNLDGEMGMGLTVLDTGTLAIDGLPLHYLVVQFDEFQTGPPQDTIVERIGFLHYYWDAQAVYLFDAGFSGLRCYADTEIDFQVGTPESCTSIMSTPSESSRGRITLSPNPTEDLVTVRSEAIEGVTLRDASGRLNYSSDFPPRERTEVKLTEYPAGPYILSVRQGGDWSHHRLLKR